MRWMENQRRKSRSKTEKICSQCATVQTLAALGSSIYPRSLAPQSNTRRLTENKTAISQTCCRESWTVSTPSSTRDGELKLYIQNAFLQELSMTLVRTSISNQWNYCITMRASFPCCNLRYLKEQVQTSLRAHRWSNSIQRWEPSRICKAYLATK